MFKIFKCKVKFVDSDLPERFKLNSEWYYSHSSCNMFYIDGKYFTLNEFNKYIQILPEFSN